MRLRLLPDDTRFPFMKGRIAGLVVSAVLSIASLLLFVAPGPNWGIDFQGGVVLELRTEGPAQFDALRNAFGGLNLGEVGLQQFGSADAVLVRFEAPGDAEGAQTQAVARVTQMLREQFPQARVVRTELVGARVSDELFRDGMTALVLSFVAMAAYIWFRFEWQFAAGALVTLILDVTKTIGFIVLFRLEFTLTMVAAILTIVGYSMNDKVVVYDRMRENLRKYKAMPLRELIDLSINETLNRTIGTSVTLFLACLPLAIWGGSALEDFALVNLFGIVVGTSSSIFIAAPILLFLGENRLRRGAEELPVAKTP